MENIIGEGTTPNTIYTDENLKKSIAAVKTAQKNEPVEITDNSRVNEQEFFAAIMHRGLGSTNTRAGKVFERKLPELLESLKEGYASNHIFVAVRKILRTLVRKKIITRSQRKELRQFAIGRSQLDSNRTRLSVARLDDTPDDTPVRAVKTAIRKFKENQIATKEELAAFRTQNKLELRQLQ